MKTYTEDDLRRAFQAGKEYGKFIEKDEYAPFITELDEDEYIGSLEIEQEEETVSFTYSFLRRKLEWSDICELTGVDYYAINNGFEIKDSEVFEIKESKAKEYNLI